MRLKYEKPIWQFVKEAADNVGKEVFTASDIIRKIHETNPEVPELTIRTFVVAMVPNHPTSRHYPSTRKNHPYFYYLGDGKFRLLKLTDNPSPPPIGDPSPPRTGKDDFLKENRAHIVSWVEEHQPELIAGRKNYGWNGKTLIEAITERNKVSKDIVLSRIRNNGGLDFETINQVMFWGGLRQIK